MYVEFKYMLARTIELDVYAELELDESDCKVIELFAEHNEVGVEIDDIYIGNEKRDLIVILNDLACKEAAL